MSVKKKKNAAAAGPLGGKEVGGPPWESKSTITAVQKQPPMYALYENSSKQHISWSQVRGFVCCAAVF